jgi:hypothetical protein
MSEIIYEFGKKGIHGVIKGIVVIIHWEKIGVDMDVKSTPEDPFDDQAFTTHNIYPVKTETRDYPKKVICEPFTATEDTWMKFIHSEYRGVPEKK